MEQPVAMPPEGVGVPRDDRVVDTTVILKHPPPRTTIRGPGRSKVQGTPPRGVGWAAQRIHGPSHPPSRGPLEGAPDPSPKGPPLDPSGACLANLRSGSNPPRRVLNGYEADGEEIRTSRCWICAM